MSSTNRGAVRRESDFYETPPYCVTALLHRLRELGGRYTNILIAEKVLEPCAGHGAIIKAYDEYRSKELGAPPPLWTAVEIREEARNHLDAVQTNWDKAYYQDFLTWRPLPGERFDLCITNPPFNLALPIIERAMTMADMVVMLLRVNFLGSQLRSQWHREFPADIGIMDIRPSFTGGSKTDSPEYGWWIFDKNAPGGKWFIIPCAEWKPKKERVRKQ
jgi:hypothetical protein